MLSTDEKPLIQECNTEILTCIEPLRFMFLLYGHHGPEQIDILADSSKLWH